MSIVASTQHHRLRYNHRGGADGSRQLRGVIIEDRIPGDSWLRVTLDQPSELPQSDAIQQGQAGASNAPCLFVIERAERPTVVSVAGSVSFRKPIRTLSVGGAIPNGVMMVAQVEPAWVAQALTPVIPATGLVLKGRHTGLVAAWPVDPASGPSFTGVPGSGHVPPGQLLRIRWVGQTAVVAGVLVAAPGGTSTFSGQLGGATPHVDIAPGSIVITASVGGVPITIRDTGDGRLVGQQAVAPNARADGTIDYRTGQWTLQFSANTDAGNITGNYEHNTRYLPLDVELQWDSEAQ